MTLTRRDLGKLFLTVPAAGLFARDAFAARGAAKPDSKWAGVQVGLNVPYNYGTRTMPVWGYEFWIEEGGDRTAQEEMRKTIAKLVDYLRSIQADKIASNRD